MCFSPLVMQVKKLHIPTAKPAIQITIYERPGEWDQAPLRIWPLGGEPVRWPGEKGLDGYIGFVALGDRFTRPEDGLNLQTRLASSRIVSGEFPGRLFASAVHS
jgi:hypothetical protein